MRQLSCLLRRLQNVISQLILLIWMMLFTQILFASAIEHKCGEFTVQIKILKGRDVFEKRFRINGVIFCNVMEYEIMARLPRFVLAGQPQHVIQRGNNRQAIFCIEKDYHYYLDKLLLAANEHECQIHSNVLMTNHVHLLVSPLKEDGISKMM